MTVLGKLWRRVAVRGLLAVWTVAAVGGTVENGTAAEPRRGERPTAASIRVDCGKTEGQISPLLYGAGFEHLGGAVHRGLDAQMLDGLSFEEDDVNEDGVSDKWQQVGWGNNVPVYNRDGRYSYHGRYCQQVAVLAYVDGERGIRQSGLAVQAGATYTATLHLKRWGRAPVHVTLASGDQVLAEAAIHDVASKWKRYTVQLRPVASATNAEFRVTLAGGGTLWIDQVALVPDDTYKGHGTRKDLMEKIVAVGPTVVRWPGG